MSIVKIILLFIAFFSFVHVYRDYLQIKGVKNWFTEIGHFWDAPQYEKHGMVVATIVGIICLFLFFL